MDSISPRTQPATAVDRSMTARDWRAHEQFAREHAEQAPRTRAALMERAK
jgi:hypothetical protein